MKSIDRLHWTLRDRPCEVFVGTGALDAAARGFAAIAAGRRVAVLADAHVLSLHGGALERAWESAGVEASTHALPRGEAAKSFSVVEDACRRLVGAGVERGDVLVGVGGGAATDAAGFVAAILLRGISAAYVPTSLLAMVDAAIGGKTAIDLPEGKNLVGAFHQPRLVGCDLDLLRTLPEREFRAGLAEIVKIAWIADAELFARLEAEPLRADAGDALRDVVRRAIELKMRVVARDERDEGARLVLNFGHTWGHAIETASRGALLHGEAVALGLVCAVKCSVESGRCPASDLDRLVALLTSLGLPTSRPDVDANAVVERAHVDKKRARGSIRAVLTQGVGSVSVADHVSDEVLRRSVDFLRR